MPTAIEITGADAAGQPRTLYWATGSGFATKPTDLPANTVFLPGIVQPGSFRRAIFRPGGDTFGRSEVGFGIVEIANTGAHDHLLGWAFDGRTIVIRRGSKGDAYPSAWTMVLTGTIEGVEFTQRTIRFHLRDEQARVADTLITEDTWAGTNSAPSGLEGTPDDIAGQYEPVAYGNVRNARLTNVNASRWIYQSRWRADLTVAHSDAYDRGVALTEEADYADIATLDSATAPSSGAWKAFEGNAIQGAYLRTGSKPDAEISADFTVGTAAQRTAAQIMRQALLDAGVSALNISGDTAIDGTFPFTCGFFRTEAETRAGEVLDAMAASVHGYWIATRFGKFKLGRLLAPSGSPVQTFESWRLLDPANALRRITGPQEGIPVWRVTVRYQRNWFVQNSEQIDNSNVTELRREWLRNETRSITVSDDSVKARHPLAREIEIETLIDSEADAQTLADFLLATYSVRRDIYEIQTRCPCADTVDLGDVISVDVPRFDLDGGKLFRVIGIDEDLRSNTANLTIWG
jgi:hypothetical protein